MMPPFTSIMRLLRVMSRMIHGKTRDSHLLTGLSLQAADFACDVNGDGSVNVLDLLPVCNQLGTRCEE